VLVGALLSGALLGVPLLLLSTGAVVSSALPAGAGGGRTLATADPRARVVLPGLQQVKFASPAAIATTTTTAAPPTTTAAPPTTVPRTTPPTTERPAVATTTTTAAGPTNTATGLATWYAAAPAGYCASTSLAFGTVLTITDDATGGVITCTVDDRETAGPPHLVDLSPEGFSALEPLSQGVITVTVTW
jgi:rare lipoprotein A (peptidoglycan hydrolase)